MSDPQDNQPIKTIPSELKKFVKSKYEEYSPQDKEALKHMGRDAKDFVKGMVKNEEKKFSNFKKHFVQEADRQFGRNENAATRIGSMMQGASKAAGKAAGYPARFAAGKMNKHATKLYAKAEGQSKEEAEKTIQKAKKWENIAGTLETVSKGFEFAGKGASMVLTGPQAAMKAFNYLEAYPEFTLGQFQDALNKYIDHIGKEFGPTFDKLIDMPKEYKTAVKNLAEKITPESRELLQRTPDIREKLMDKKVAENLIKNPAQINDLIANFDQELMLKKVLDRSQQTGQFNNEEVGNISPPITPKVPGKGQDMGIPTQ